MLEGGFGLEHLVLREASPPDVGPEQLLLRMAVASLNYRDLLMVRGEYDKKLKLPFVPVSDGVGWVEQCGANVEDFQVGERVCPVVANGWYSNLPERNTLRQTRGGPLDGVLQDYMLINSTDCVRPPALLSDVQAATLPCAALTAFSALFRHGALKPGQFVLTLGTGGVSIFALQFAKALGAKVIVTSHSNEKLERARALGADFVVNYREIPAWGRHIRGLAGGEGVDHVIEVGGPNTLNESLQAVRPGGQISLIGVLGGSLGDVNLLPILMRDVRLQGVFIGPRSSFVEMNHFIEQHQILPIVDKLFELTEIRAAFEHLATGNQFGKVCVRLSDAHTAS